MPFSRTAALSAARNRSSGRTPVTAQSLFLRYSVRPYFICSGGPESTSMQRNSPRSQPNQQKSRLSSPSQRPRCSSALTPALEDEPEPNRSPSAVHRKVPPATEARPKQQVTTVFAHNNIFTVLRCWNSTGGTSNRLRVQFCATPLRQQATSGADRGTSVVAPRTLSAVPHSEWVTPHALPTQSVAATLHQGRMSVKDQGIPVLHVQYSGTARLGNVEAPPPPPPSPHSPPHHHPQTPSGMSAEGA